MSSKLIQTSTQDWCVSTIRRQSSCIETPEYCYYEIFVWSLDEKGKFKHILHEDDASNIEHALVVHNKWVDKMMVSIPPKQPVVKTFEGKEL